ncbi:zf-HC2 domain-containing protein [Rhodopseudomonas sp. BR0M22]|uniref:zf-HC2 domain-containing protein n=1 Tax=Rhodopseudomonas sp. BR0M22 TaxID=2269369 RepID=UPI0013DFBC6A|nr:zf-HC2 domain-containing protein [Rhodopseudomonas sp. BR0M22]NEW91260.1 zf-HC2 domain-containing protein [Rhodopseudomonas sp. BR0M22]
MMAMSKTMPEHSEPGDIEALLPWYAAGTLDPRDTRRVAEALDRDPELARQYAVILEEYSATIELNESLGAPSSRTMHKLFAAIDAEPAQQPAGGPGLGERFAGFFAGLSPKALAWSAAAASVALLLQAGLIGAMLAWHHPGTVQTAAYQPQNDVAPPAAAPRERTAEAAKPAAPMVMAERSGGPVVRSLTPPTAPRALVKFSPDARAAEISALLDRYDAVVVDSSRGGVFRLQFGNHALSKQAQDDLIARLQKEPIVNVVLSAP